MVDFLTLNTHTNLLFCKNAITDANIKSCCHAIKTLNQELEHSEGAIHSTKIPTGPTGKSGPPQKVDPFFRNFSGWTESIHWVLDRNFRKFWLNVSRRWCYWKPPSGDGYFLGYWGCAAGWGRNFTTGLTIMGVAFSMELLEWCRTFSDFMGQDGSSYLRIANVPERLYCRWKVFFIQCKKGVTDLFKGLIRYTEHKLT